MGRAADCSAAKKAWKRASARAEGIACGKAASDADLPLVGVGLLYQKGYLRQYLNPDGWQQERYPINDFYNLPVRQASDASPREKARKRAPAPASTAATDSPVARPGSDSRPGTAGSA